LKTGCVNANAKLGELEPWVNARSDTIILATEKKLALESDPKMLMPWWPEQQCDDGRRRKKD